MKKFLVKILILLITTLLFACGNTTPPPPAAPDIDHTKPSHPNIGIYDSLDTVIISNIDTEARTITFINFELDKPYTLEYNGVTTFMDKYEKVLSVAQLMVGEVVDVSFLKSEKLLVSLFQSKEAFTYENISRYTLDGGRKVAVIGENTYRLTNSALVVSDGRRIDVADIVNRDVVTIRGFDRDIWSIVVQSGHGYLRLINDIYAIGGWIEIGQTHIQRITDNMLLVVPEGTFEVRISARGFSTTRRVTIDRNRETVIDLGDVVVESPRTGRVIFNVEPINAAVFIDGREIDIRNIIELEFGLYQVICMAPGYDTVTIHIRVSEENASVSIIMDREGTNVNNNNNTSVSGNELPLEVGRNRVYIEAPVDVEVYQDGVYMGISPVHFEKVAGSRTITLRHQGFITKSYQIHLDNEPTDVTYSFSALERMSLEIGNTVSGNN